MPANQEFLEMAGRTISKSLRRIGPKTEPAYESLSVESAQKALALWESKPRFHSELSRKLSELEIDAGIRTNGAIVSIKARVSAFSKKSGKRFKVFRYQDQVYIVRKEDK
jgi:hypothetical protein